MIILGLIGMEFGGLGVWYAEKLRKKRDLDFLSVKGYIFSILAVVLGIYFIVSELLKMG